jgi:hypothetical protein
MEMHNRLSKVEAKFGISVSCPGLPGCWSQGATEEEALANPAGACSRGIIAILLTAC